MFFLFLFLLPFLFLFLDNSSHKRTLLLQCFVGLRPFCTPIHRPAHRPTRTIPNRARDGQDTRHGGRKRDRKQTKPHSVSFGEAALTRCSVNPPHLYGIACPDSVCTRALPPTPTRRALPSRRTRAKRGWEESGYSTVEKNSTKYAVIQSTSYSYGVQIEKRTRCFCHGRAELLFLHFYVLSAGKSPQPHPHVWSALIINKG